MTENLESTWNGGMYHPDIEIASEEQFREEYDGSKPVHTRLLAEKTATLSMAEFEKRARKFTDPKDYCRIFTKENYNRVALAYSAELSQNETKKIESLRNFLPKEQREAYENSVKPLYYHQFEVKCPPFGPWEGGCVSSHYGVEFVRPFPYKSPPRRLPKSAHPRVAEINALLQKSIDFQSSKSSKHGLEPFLNFNNSFAANAMVYYFLRHLNLVQDDEIELIYGVLYERHPEAGIDGLPHYWLEINGHIIDNMNRHNPVQSLKKRTLKQYLKVCPTETSLRVLRHVQYRQEFGRVFSKRPDLIEKGLILRLYAQGEQLNTLSDNILHELMREFGWLEHQILVPYLNEKWDQTCWNCFEVLVSFQRN